MDKKDKTFTISKGIWEIQKDWSIKQVKIDKVINLVKKKE